MFLHQSAYLDHNPDHAGNPHHDWKIPHREELYANVYIRPTNWRFENIELWNCHRLGQGAYWAAVRSALESAAYVSWVEVHLFFCVPRVSADSLLCHFGRVGSQMFGFDKALPAVFVLQLSPFIPRNHNTPLLLFSDLGTCFLNDIFCFLYCRARNAFFCHFGHIQHQAHVGRYQLYPTSLPCHSCWHVENLQLISCCF